MTPNENLNSPDPRAQSQHAEAESEGSGSQRTSVQPNVTPKHNPSLLPESYLQTRGVDPRYAEQVDKTFSAHDDEIAPEQSGEQHAQAMRQLADITPEELPIDCTIQMRGRNLGNPPDGSDIPWEKPAEPPEEEEKILPLPMPPPPSATNNRLQAMQPPIDSDRFQAQVQQASSDYDAQSLNAIASPRQAVRYKPASPSPSKINTQGGRSVQPEPVEQMPPANPRPVQASSKQFYSEEELVPASRTRVNPNLLKSSSDSKSGKIDTSFRPQERRAPNAAGAMPKFSWTELQYLLKFYVKEVSSLLMNPSAFFQAHADDPGISEPITFMVLSGGIAAVFMSFAGDIGGGMSTLFGTSAYAIIATIAVHYAMDFLNASNEPKGDLKSTFKILAYSQAPLLIAWIKLGVVPVGWWAAFVYAIYLCVVGLEQVYGMNRQKSLIIMIVVSLVIHGLLHLLSL